MLKNIVAAMAGVAVAAVLGFMMLYCIMEPDDMYTRPPESVCGSMI